MTSCVCGPGHGLHSTFVPQFRHVSSIKQFLLYRAVKGMERIHIKAYRSPSTSKSLGGGCCSIYSADTGPHGSRPGPRKLHLTPQGEAESWVNRSFHAMGYVLLSVRSLIHTDLSKGELILTTKSKGRLWIQVFRGRPPALVTVSSFSVLASISVAVPV